MEKHRKEQSDCEYPCEHRPRRTIGDVINMQGSERECSIRDEDPDDRRQTSDKRRLKNAAVCELLINPPRQLSDHHDGNRAPKRGSSRDGSQTTTRDEEEDDVR